MQYDGIDDKSLIKFGKMEKDPFEMTPEEYKVWEEEMEKEIRTHLFSIGQPLVYRKDGQMIAEFADGGIKKLH